MGSSEPLAMAATRLRRQVMRAMRRCPVPILWCWQGLARDGRVARPRRGMAGQGRVVPIRREARLASSAPHIQAVFTAG